MHDYFLVNHGKSGVLGSFALREPLHLGRGDRVLVQSPRGLEVGTVLCPATVRQSRLLGGKSSGQLLRAVSAEDEVTLARLEAREQELFAAGRHLAADMDLPVEVLDAELLFDVRHAFLHLVSGPTSWDAGPWVHRLEEQFALEVRWLDVASGGPGEEAEEHGGCGKPGCGKAEGGCSSCGSGGCSSCGRGSVDLRPYFAHLRGEMETGRRTPLL